MLFDKSACFIGNRNLNGHSFSSKIPRMYFKNILLWVLAVASVALSYKYYGWPGVAVLSGGILMWMLLHFTRMMAVMRRAAERPIGYVASAVMLNAKLKTGMTLLHVVAMTRAFGKLLSTKGEQPEIFRWTDNGESHVTCEFRGGKLAKWEMVRPEPEEVGKENLAPEVAEVSAVSGATAVAPADAQKVT